MVALLQAVHHRPALQRHLSHVCRHRRVGRHKLRSEAVEANPKNDTAWYNLCNALITRWRGDRQGNSLPEALTAGETAVRLGGNRYNYACALAVVGRVSEALDELAESLKRGEITKAEVAADVDWEHLRDDPRFIKLIGHPPDEAAPVDR